MPLDRTLQHIFAQAKASGAPDLTDLPPEAARAVYRQILAAADVAPADVDVTSHTIDGPDGALPLRVYRPRREAVQGIVVYYHGGGFVLGDLDGYDNVCRQLCEDSGGLVVSVGYRLAPEHPFPAAIDDAWAALEWVAANAGEIASRDARIAVAGDSAGALLATVMCILARDRRGPVIAFQALVYPPAAAGSLLDFPSRTLYADGPTLTARMIDYFNGFYFGAEGPPRNALAAPLCADDLAGLPPALLQIGTYDPLRDEALAYGQRLLEAGNDAIVVEYHGLPHGFVSMGGAVRAARLAQRQLAQALRDALQPTAHV
ncbi:alpha/beta hydrolase [Trinickia acidisoli]|uniref:alpha/beta hydrolase n=1 Tax=Trinickia acidisoli TaxID=2767482 RepID=UPI001F5D3C63|nr:alpha/beta hydrolase [Trinickia acidisoli]